MPSMLTKEIAMKQFMVFGEYGPQGHQSISLLIEAEDAAQAKDLFCADMELNHPHEWQRMGRRNVTAQEQPAKTA